MCEGGSLNLDLDLDPNPPNRDKGRGGEPARREDGRAAGASTPIAHTAAHSVLRGFFAVDLPHSLARRRGSSTENFREEDDVAPL